MPICRIHTFNMRLIFKLPFPLYFTRAIRPRNLYKWFHTHLKNIRFSYCKNFGCLILDNMVFTSEMSYKYQHHSILGSRVTSTLNFWRYLGSTNKRLANLGSSFFFWNCQSYSSTTKSISFTYLAKTRLSGVTPESHFL